MKIFSKCVAFLCLLSIYTGSTYANNIPLNGYSRLEFNNIGVREELGVKVVYCVWQDPMGRIWFGTLNGLSYYDGYRITRYNCVKAIEGGTINLRVNAMVPRDPNTLWVATDAGLYLFDLNSKKFTPTLIASQLMVNDLKQSGDGTLWVSTTSGITAIDRNGEPISGFTPALSTKNHYTTGYINRDRNFIGTVDNLLVFFDKSSHSFKSQKLDFVTGQITALLELYNNPNKIYVATTDALYLHNRETNTVQKVLENIFVKNLIYDRNNNLWVGTNVGLIKITPDGKQSTYVHLSDNPITLPSSVINGTFIDVENNLWLATDNGVSRVSLEQRSHYFSLWETTGINRENQIYKIFKDRHQNLFLLGTNGLVIYNEKERKSRWLSTFASDPSLRIAHNVVRHVCRDDGDLLWIGTDAGLHSLDMQTGKIRRYRVDGGSYPSRWIYHIERGAGDELYVATYKGGLYVFDRRALIGSGEQELIKPKRHYVAGTGANSLSGNSVTRLMMTDSTTLYATIMNAGIDRITMGRDGHVTHFNVKSDNLGSNNVVAMVKGDRNDLIILTGQGGLEKLDPMAMKFSPLKIDHLDEQIKSVSEGREGMLWLSCGSGIKKLNMRTLQMSSHGKVAIKDKIVNCIYFDPVLSRYYWASDDAYGYLDIDDLDQPMPRRNMFITGLLVSGKQIETGIKYQGNEILKGAIESTSSIELLHNQNSFTIEFSSLTFAPEQSVTYKYRLKGLSEEWVKSFNDNNRAMMLNVPHGHYVFEVVRIDDNGKPLSNVASIRIAILAPWYLSFVAYIIYTLLGIGFAMGLWRLIAYKQKQRLEELRRQKSFHFSQMKIDFLSNLFNEVRTPLSVILSRSSAMLGSNSEVGQGALDIFQSAEQLRLLTSQFVHTIQADHEKVVAIEPSKLDFVEFCRSAASGFASMAKQQSVRLNFESRITHATVYIDHGRFTQALDNLLYNALKFTPEGGVIDLILESLDPKRLRLTICNTGSGIPPKDLEQVFDRFYDSSISSEHQIGFGLSIARDIIVQHAATIDVSSIEGHNTTFTLELPCIEFSDQSSAVATETQQQNISVLVVNSNTKFEGNVLTLLAEQFVCHYADTNESGFAMALELTPSIIVIDMSEQSEHREELVRRLRENIYTAAEPIIAISSGANRQTEISSYSSGVDAFLPHPIDVGNLTLRIWQLVHKAKSQNEKIRQNIIATPAGVAVESPDSKFIASMTQIIEDHLHDTELSISTLTTESGISAKGIYRKIKHLTGLSPTEYIRSTRLKKAAFLLSQEGFSISEVLYMVGFSNHSYFTKCFKIEFGMTPKEFSKTKSHSESLQRP